MKHLKSHDSKDTNITSNIPIVEVKEHASKKCIYINDLDFEEFQNLNVDVMEFKGLCKKIMPVLLISPTFATEIIEGFSIIEFLINTIKGLDEKVKSNDDVSSFFHAFRHQIITIAYLSIETHQSNYGYDRKREVLCSQIH